MTTMFPGQVNAKGTYPNLFDVADTIAGQTIALSVKDDGCKLDFRSA